MRLLIAIFIVLTIYTIQDRLYRSHWNRELIAGLSFSRDFVNIGETVILTEVIENRKSLPLPVLHVKFRASRTFRFADEENAQISDYYYRDDVFSVLGKQQVTRSLSFTVTHRGYFPLTELHITSRNLFLTTTYADVLPNQAALYVLPDRLPLRHFSSIHEQMLGDFHTNRQSVTDPFAFYGIRPYQSFDTMKSINWKATAHTGTMMVNQYQPAASGEIRILLNLTPYMKSCAEGLFEHGINIANTVGTAFMEDAIDVSLYTNACDILTKEHPCLKAGHGTQHKQSLARLLSRIDASLSCSDFLTLVKEWIGKEDHPVSYILISTYRDDAMLSFFRKMAAAVGMYWIIPEYSYDEIPFTHPNILKWEL